MKKILIITLILVASLIIGILAILTAIKLTTEKPVTPNVPQVKPRAQEVSPTPPPSACTVTFTLNPTLTPSPGPSATPTVTPSPSVTPSPTPGTNIPPTCTGLTANPTSGDAPLLVNFVASGFDDNAGFLAGFEFNFGDGESKKIEQTFKTTDTFTITHTYANTGSFVATVRVKDNNGDWSDIPPACKQTITVKGAGPTVTPIVPTATPPPIGAPVVTPTITPVVVVPKIPTAGNALPAVLTIGGGALLLLLGWVAL